MNKLKNISATQILKLIEEGSITSRQVVEYFIREIEEVNPSLNAVVIKLFDKALKEADRADSLFKEGKRTGRLHGLPFTIKECLDLVGTPSTFGLLRRQKDIPLSSDIYVRVLQNEGAIVIGKTNVSQLLATIESQNPVYGITNNPYSIKHTSGGSSGGEGAIIAAGGSPIGLGTDIGGSVRIPAAFNGICGIKPTVERTIDKARFLERDLNLPIKSVTGILANHAEDLHLFLDIMNETNGPKMRVLEDFKKVNISNLKIGYMLTDKVFEPMEAIKRSVQEAIDKLNALGVETALFQPPDLLEAEEIYTKILTADKMPIFSENLQKDKVIKLLRDYFLLANAPKWLRNMVYHLSGIVGQKTLKRAVHYFGGVGEENLSELKKRKKIFTERYLSAMDNSPIGKLDAIICPAFPLPAILHNTADRIGVGGTYTIQSNITGFPSGVAAVSTVKEKEAISRKFSLDVIMLAAAKNERKSAGLPIGIQIMAKPWQDHIVIALIEKLHVSINPDNNSPCNFKVFIDTQ